MYMVLVPKSKTRKEKGKFGAVETGKKEVKVRKPASPLLIVGLPVALFK